jgi:hypothetical protein
MRKATILAAALAVSLAAACGNDEKPADDGQPVVAQRAAQRLTPEQLGEIGAEIRKDPGRAEEILSRRGLDRRSFEKQIRDVTEDPDAAKRYAEAYRKSSA